MHTQDWKREVGGRQQMAGRERGRRPGGGGGGGGRRTQFATLSFVRCNSITFYAYTDIIHAMIRLHPQNFHSDPYKRE